RGCRQTSGRAQHGPEDRTGDRVPPGRRRPSSTQAELRPWSGDSAPTHGTGGHSPPWSPHKSHSPPWSPHTSHSPLCYSWSRHKLAHSSTRACSSWTGSSHRSHSPPWSPHKSHSPPWSPHTSHSPLCYSWSSPHSWSHSLRNSHSSSWFWCRERRRAQVWRLLGRGPLYTCQARGTPGHTVTSSCLFTYVMCTGLIFKLFAAP
uniref:Uncharacterized protein n=1 Tax=Sus scrofa TaxID=9823 RepID=A0A8D1I2A7_PIG